MRITRLDNRTPAPARAGTEPGSRTPAGTRQATAGFDSLIDGGAAAGAEVPGAAEAAPPEPVAGCLASAGPADAGARDDRARRHGGALLHALASLQAGLLGGGAAGARQRLAALAQARPAAADPALEEALQAIALRAAVELAKAG